MTGEPRSREQRKRDVLALLSAPVADCWVATGEAFLIPLTLAWFEQRILLATDLGSRTARNLAESGRARIALGATRDVALIDATLEKTIPVAESGPAGVAYAEQSDWDPRTAGDDYAFLVLRPQRIQAWRELNEIPGRTLMRDGDWL